LFFVEWKVATEVYFRLLLPEYPNEHSGEEGEEEYKGEYRVNADAGDRF
jgi:hypothetical protein